VFELSNDFHTIVTYFDPVVISLYYILLVTYIMNNICHQLCVSVVYVTCFGQKSYRKYVAGAEQLSTLSVWYFHIFRNFRKLYRGRGV